MIDLVINYRNLDFAKSNITRLVDSATLRGLNNTGRKGVTIIRGKTPVGVRGNLKAGIFYKIAGTIRQRALVFDVKGVGKRYAEYREEGRKPGKRPPPGKIEEWIEGTPRGRKFLAAIMRRYGIKNREAGVRSAAFLKGRAIGRMGYKGAFMFKKSLPEIKRIVRVELQAQIVSTLSRLK